MGMIHVYENTRKGKMENETGDGRQERMRKKGMRTKKRKEGG